MVGRKVLGNNVSEQRPIVFFVQNQEKTERIGENQLERIDCEVRVVGTSTQFLCEVDSQCIGTVVWDLDRADNLDVDLRDELSRRNLCLGLVLLVSGTSFPRAIDMAAENGVTSTPTRRACSIHMAYSADSLIRAVTASLEESRCTGAQAAHQRTLELRLTELSKQEREVLHFILKGYKNRTIASRLGVSLRTVENRRRRCFEVMGASSLAELARLVLEYDQNLGSTADTPLRWLNLPYIPSLVAS